MTTPKIVLVGHVCIDHNTTEDATYTGWGSSVLYIADYLQRAHQIEATVISTYGPDMMQYLPPVKLLPTEPSVKQTLVYENDTRSLPRIWKAHKTEYSHPPELTPEIIAAVHDADIVIVATLLPDYPTDYIKELLGHAKQSALTVLLPQGYFRHIGEGGLVIHSDSDELPEIVPLFDLTAFSEEDNARAFEHAKAWRKAAPNTNVVVTQGANGASIIEPDGRLHHIPTIPLSQEEIVDSVGCGDVFQAMLTYNFWRTGDLEASVREAHRAATDKLLAIAVTTM